MSKIVCYQMARGALGYFSSASMTTIDTLKSLSNMYNLPFLTWSNYPRTYYKERVNNQTMRLKRDLESDDEIVYRSKRQNNNVKNLIKIFSNNLILT